MKLSWQSWNIIQVPAKWIVFCYQSSIFCVIVEVCYQTKIREFYQRMFQTKPYFKNQVFKMITCLFNFRTVLDFDLGFPGFPFFHKNVKIPHWQILVDQALILESSSNKNEMGENQKDLSHRYCIAIWIFQPFLVKKVLLLNPESNFFPFHPDMKNSH